MEFKRIGYEDPEASFAAYVHRIGEFAPATVAISEVEYDDKTGMHGVLIIDFGDKYDDNRRVDPFVITRLCDAMNTELVKLSEKQQGK